MTADPQALEIVRRALKEDIAGGDVTTLSLVPEHATAQAHILSRGDLVVAGTAVAAAVFHELDPALRLQVLIDDGERATDGAPIMSVEGAARPILTGERTALNFMQRMTGIATLTARFVEEVKPYGTIILDTRKTTPTLRLLEKYAVTCGGGKNHRSGLYDMMLIKDNHRALWATVENRSLEDAVRQARTAYPGVPVEVEVETEAELESALRAAPEWVLLDNMRPDALRRCVALCAGRARLEASGGIALDSVAEVAATGVDAISLGCLTHSAPAADLSLEIVGYGMPGG